MTSAVPTLHVSNLSLDDRRSAADGQLGSVSPRPVKRGVPDDSPDVYAQPIRNARSPSQPMMSLLEHSEFRLRKINADGEQDAAEALSGGGTMHVRCHAVLVEGRPQLSSPPDPNQRALLTPTNPTKAITSVALSNLGTHVAVGDRMGRVWIANRPPERMSSGGDEPRRGGFQFWIGKRCYAPVIDPLNSVEVTAAVNRLTFLPQFGPTLHLLTANEKVPKLYKMMEVRQTSKAPSAVSSIGSKVVGPLTSPQKVDTVAMKQVHHYAMDHEYTIHSVCATSDGMFYTADDLVVRQWCVDYPQSSVEVYAMRRPTEAGDAKELLRSLSVFPWEPALCFMATTAGCVRVVDTRESMRWSDREALSFSVRPREASDGPFMELTNAFSGCSLSPCGRYLCARDFMSVPVWDVRKSGDASPTSQRNGALIRRYELHPELRPRFDVLYQSDLLMEKYDVHFLSSNVIVSGSFDNVLCSITLNNNDGGGQLEGEQEGGSSIPQPLEAVQGVVKCKLPSGPLPETGAALECKPSNYFACKAETGGHADEHHSGRVTALTTPLVCNGQVELCAGYGENLAHVTFPL